MKNATLGDRIKALRGAEARPVFAKRFNLSIDTIIRYENGQTFPGADFILKMCNYYNISSDWLIFGDEKYPEKAPQQTPEKPQQTPPPPKQQKEEIAINYNMIAKKRALDLPPSEFKELWDQFWDENEARRGWLQIEAITRFPEFLEWLEQRGERLIMPHPITLKRAGMVNQMAGVMGLEDE